MCVWHHLICKVKLFTEYNLFQIASLIDTIDSRLRILVDGTKSPCMCIPLSQNLEVFQVIKCSVLPKQSSRHDRRAWLGWSLWLHQSLWIIPIPTSKEILYWRLVGPTCLRHAGENTEMMSMHVLNLKIRAMGPWWCSVHILPADVCVHTQLRSLTHTPTHSRPHTHSNTCTYVYESSEIFDGCLPMKCVHSLQA